MTVPGIRRGVNIADVGFGASQALPILVVLATAPPGSTILIEQPELHLHPRAQVAMADLLIEAVVSRGLQVVMESHSEHMFLRVRRRVAEGLIQPSQVSAQVVDRAKVRRVDIDGAGQIDTNVFPPGFFAEEWTEALALARAAARSGG